MNISNISSLTPLSGSGSATKSLPASGEGFGSMIKDAVESIDSTQKNAESEIAKAVTGESTDLHKTIIALQTADLKFQLGMQVRNKLLGAYDEIMRMPV
ncbi:flagellar hook-basal body complex protein FliE [soil metagenome]